jgi:hypothetical protein
VPCGLAHRPIVLCAASAMAEPVQAAPPSQAAQVLEDVETASAASKQRSGASTVSSGIKLDNVRS